MWKQKGSLKSCWWCLPRKVVNIYAENKLPIEKLKHNNEVKEVVKDTRQIRKLVRPKIKENKFFKQNCDSTVSGKINRKMKKQTLPSKASKRVMELALPKTLTSLKKVTKDLRDPFKVNPSALKAICSPRIKLLARPTGYRKCFLSH
ncbi:hypothetical protein M0804_002848 [Polistes exclamans]|nr:hypothetical protein M0804_002848 [Polistes exclamans]